MIVAGDPEGTGSHDTYHRFVRGAKWSLNELWRALVVVMVATFTPEGPVPVLIDDTLFKKSGRKMEGTGIFRDAVRSTKSKVVYALGLNLVVATLRVNAPWGGCPISLPVGVRLHRKGGPTTVALAVDLCRQFATWLPERSLQRSAPTVPTPPSSAESWSEQRSPRGDPRDRLVLQGRARPTAGPTTAHRDGPHPAAPLRLVWPRNLRPEALS